MSRISSISTAIRAKDNERFTRPSRRAQNTALVAVPRSRGRSAHPPRPPQLAAFSAHVLAGQPRRGLKGDPAEQARIFKTYARMQNRQAPLGGLLKIEA
ncbi:MAG: hypothetical protein COA84_05200 [Robiginitomaculum sp.]|nr:MAG: hypothetical protein COA84_05200 [Robiginitomaculum sp.]